jgi:cation transport ATPase
MESIGSPSVSKSNESLSGLWIGAFLITNLFLFVDEGYYDFRWMSNVGNWIAFALYLVMIFLVEYFFFKLIFRKTQGVMKSVYSVLSTIGVSVLFIIATFFI